MSDRQHRGRARGRCNHQPTPHHERNHQARAPSEPISDIPNRHYSGPQQSRNGNRHYEVKHYEAKPPNQPTSDITNRNSGPQNGNRHEVKSYNARPPNETISDMPNRHFGLQHGKRHEEVEHYEARPPNETIPDMANRRVGPNGAQQNQKGLHREEGNRSEAKLTLDERKEIAGNRFQEDHTRSVDGRDRFIEQQPIQKNLNRKVYLAMKKFETTEIDKIRDNFNLSITEIPFEGESDQIQIWFSTENPSVNVLEAIGAFHNLFQQTKREMYNLPIGYAVNKQLLVYIHTSNITKINVSGIVNAANGELFHAGGVAKAIADVAGPNLIKASKEAVRSHKKEFDTSDVIATTAGKLPCDAVLHAVGPRWPGTYSTKGPKPKREVAEKECVELLRATFSNVLWHSDMLGLESIALPPISSGIFGVPHRHVAEGIIHTILTFAKCTSDATLKEIHLVDIGEDILKMISLGLRIQENVSLLHLEDVIEGITNRLDLLAKRKRSITEAKIASFKSYLTEIDRQCAETGDCEDAAEGRKSTSPDKYPEVKIPEDDQIPPSRHTKAVEKTKINDELKITISTEKKKSKKRQIELIQKGDEPTVNAESSNVSKQGTQPKSYKELQPAVKSKPSTKGIAENRKRDSHQQSDATKEHTHSKANKNIATPSSKGLPKERSEREKSSSKRCHQNEQVHHNSHCKEDSDGATSTNQVSKESVNISDRAEAQQPKVSDSQKISATKSNEKMTSIFDTPSESIEDSSRNADAQGSTGTDKSGKKTTTVNTQSVSTGDSNDPPRQTKPGSGNNDADAQGSTWTDKTEKSISTGDSNGSLRKTNPGSGSKETDPVKHEMPTKRGVHSSRRGGATGRGRGKGQKSQIESTADSNPPAKRGHKGRARGQTK